MKKIVRYIVLVWFALIFIVGAIVVDYLSIAKYNDFESEIGWWLMFLFAVIPTNFLCCILVYDVIKKKDILWEGFNL